MDDDIADIINKQIKRKFMEGLFTSIPSEVISVSEYQNFQTVDVKPLINKIYEDGVVEELPILRKVPLIMLGAGGGLISFPVAVGDKVLLIFSMRDIDRWKQEDGGKTTPDTNRLHNINDAIAIPGLETFKSNLSPDPADVVIKFEGSNIKLKADGNVEINTSGNVNLNGSGEVNLGTGATESVILGDTFKTFFNTHTHATAGLGAPSPPTIPMAATELSLDVKTK